MSEEDQPAEEFEDESNTWCTPHYRLPTVSSICRSRSLSPTRRKLADVSLEDTAETRPPFVVRKVRRLEAFYSLTLSSFIMIFLIF